MRSINGGGSLLTVHEKNKIRITVHEENNTYFTFHDENKLHLIHVVSDIHQLDCSVACNRKCIPRSP